MASPSKPDPRAWESGTLAAANECLLQLWQRLLAAPGRNLQTDPQEKGRLCSLIGRIQGKLLAVDACIAEMVRELREYRVKEETKGG
jgi:hypothetical protein